MQTTNTQANGIRIETSKGTITLDKISVTDFQKKGTKTAQIRQVVTTKSFYPSQKTGSNLQANIFNTEDFGFKEQEFESTENRMAFIPVPENITNEAVIAKLEAAYASGATIYKALSNHPILDDNQVYAIDNIDTVTKDKFANSQVVRYPENEETKANGTAGQLLLDNNGKVQYRRTFFWNTAQDDKDIRTAVATDVYVSAEIKAELEGASILKGQTI